LLISTVKTCTVLRIQSLLPSNCDTFGGVYESLVFSASGIWRTLPLILILPVKCFQTVSVKIFLCFLQEFAEWYLKTFSGGILMAMLKNLDQFRQKIYVSPRYTLHYSTPITFITELSYHSSVADPECLSRSVIFFISDPSYFFLVSCGVRSKS
jgi:hypothetical protein